MYYKIYIDIYNLKYDRSIVVKMLELHMELTRDGKEIVFIWVPGHGGIRGNSVAESAAKDTFDGDISNELIPFADVKSCVNEYVLELWQSEWDEFPGNKLRKIFPHLKDSTICSLTNRREETVIYRLHIGHFYILLAPFY